MSESSTTNGEESVAAELTEREEELLDRIETYLGEHRDDLERRHWVQALASLGFVGCGARELYRRDVLKALPSLHYRSDEAADGWEASLHPSRETVPESLAGASGFAVLAALASAGSRRRAADRPLLSIATAGASLLQAVGAAGRLVDELERGEVDALSSIETILSASTVPLVLPAALRAVRGLLAR